MNSVDGNVRSDGASATGSSPAGDRYPKWPNYEFDELAAIQSVLSSGRVNYWTGEEARQFEREYAHEAGTQHAVALANGTVALELALRAYGIGPKAEVVTTARSFIASASCAVMCGARPVFADVDRDSQNISAETIERALTARTRAIIVVHLAGWPCEMDPIMELARAHGVIVIEDCAQAAGAGYRGRPVGGLAHAAGFSFCQDKIISTGGEGGMLTTNDEQVWSRAWSFKDHGKSYDAVYQRKHPPGFRWVHESFGTNWRMTEVQAAIGRVQLRKLRDWVRLRTRNADLLRHGLSGIHSIRIPQPPPHSEHAYYRFYFFVEPAALKASWSRDRIVAEISDGGVPCFSGSCPELYLEKAFDSLSAPPRPRLRISRELGETSVALLVHPTLSPDHMTRVCDVVTRVLGQATR